MANNISNRIARLIKKTSDIDKDERFMATSDICSELSHLDDAAASRAGAAMGAAGGASVGLDPAVQQSLGRTLLLLLEDSSSDVQTVSVKCLSLLCRRLSGEQLLIIVDKMAALVTDPARSDSRDIYAIGLKTMVQAVAAAGGVAGSGVSGSVAVAPPPMMMSAGSVGVDMAQRLLAGMMQGLAAEAAQRTTTSANDTNAIDLVTTILDIIKEVLLKFGAQVNEMHQPLLQQLAPRLESAHDSIRKRVISTLAALVPVLGEPFQLFMDTLVQKLALHDKQSHAAGAGAEGTVKQESYLLYAYLQMIGVVSTTAGSRIGSYLLQIVPQLEKFLVLPAQTSAPGTDLLIELSDHSLAAFESLIQSCPREFAQFLPGVLRRATELMSYDPNYEYAPEETEEGEADDMDADMDSEQTKATGGSGGGGGDDDEEEAWGAADDEGWGDEDGGAGGMDDGGDEGDDSATWKVRRAAVKVLAAFIRSSAALPSTDASGAETVDLLSLNYASLCDALLARFKERDQNVKVVVLQTMAELLRESATAHAGAGSVVASPSGQRDESMGVASPSPSPQSGVASILESKVRSIVTACLRQLRGGVPGTAGGAGVPADTKHHVLLILSELLQVRQGGLDAYLQRLVPILLANIAGSTTHHSLKLDAVELLRACIDTHGPSAWFGPAEQPAPASVGAQVSSIVSTLVQSMADTHLIKFAREVLLTVGSLLSLLGAFKAQQAVKPHPLYAAVVTPALLNQLYQLIYSNLQLHDVDQEQKEATLQALSHAFLYFGAELQQREGAASGSDRLRDCMQIVLHQRLSNELTRLASLRCVTRICYAPPESGLNVAQYVLASGETAGATGAAGSSRVLEELISFLKKDSQTLQLESVHTLLAILHNLSAQGGANGKSTGSCAAGWNPAQVSHLVREGAQHLSDADLNLSNAILQLFQALFRLCPLTLTAATPTAIEDADILLAKLMQFLRSPLLQQQNLHNIRELFHVLMQLQYPGGKPAPNGASFNPHLAFPFLFDMFLRSVSAAGGTASSAAAAQAGQTGGLSSPTYLSNAAQIVGSGLLLHIPASEQAPVLQRLIDSVQSAQTGPVADCARQFALLVLGELGRHVYLTPLTESLFFSCFNSDNESLRTASSLAFGNVVLGNISHYLPTLLRHMQSSSSSSAATAQSSSMLLMLNSLRELIHHINTGEHPVSTGGQSAPSPVTSFRSFIPTLLPLLWHHAEDSEESVRSLVSEVIGGLVIIDSAATFPEMVRLASSPKPHTRSVVITALRHALTQQQQHANANAIAAGNAHTHAPLLDTSLLQQHIPAFLRLLQDPDLSVRRQSILTVNALAHARGGMNLLASSFHSVILPTLYKHLVPDPSLVRMVDLGPFKHRIDDGLPLRKAAYQTLDTLVDVAFPLLDPAQLVRELSSGLTDQDDIIMATYQILYKLSIAHPAQLCRVLDTLPQKMMDGIKEKLKAAKTATASADATAGASGAPGGGGAGDQSSGERAKDVLRAAMRCMYSLQSMSGINSCPQFVELYQRVLKTQMLAKIIDELKQTY